MKRRKRFPLQLPPTGPATEGEKIFEVLKTKIEKPARREREENAWIRPGTWALVDERSKLRSLGRLTQAERRRLTLGGTDGGERGALRLRAPSRGSDNQKHHPAATER